MKNRAAVLFFGAVFAMATGLAGAASLTNFNATGIAAGGLVNLTNAGTTSWAVWDLPNGTNNGTTTSYAATTTNATGGVVYSAISRIGTSGALRGPSTDNSSPGFTWTAADASGSTAPPGDSLVSGVFSATLNTSGQGVQFTVSNLAALTGGQSYLVTLYGYAYGARGNATATVGATSVSQLSLNINTTARATERYQFVYNPDSTSDVLTLAYALSGTGDGSSHTGIQGVSISIIPEASSAAMALCGATALLVRRKRRF